MSTSASTWESWRTAVGLDFQTILNCAKNWIRSLVSLSPSSAAFWLEQIGLAIVVFVNRIIVAFGYIASDAEEYATNLVRPIEDWVNSLVTPIRNAVNNFYADIHDLWTTIGELAGRPIGATLAWVLDQLAIIKDWVNAEYAEARTKAIASWDWIQNAKALIDDWFATKTEELSRWLDTRSGALNAYIDNLFAPLREWWDSERARLSAFTTDRINQMIAFLEDPGTFIAGYVLDWLEWIIGSAVWRFW